MADLNLFWFGIVLILFTVAGTVYVFHRRMFEQSCDRVGEAADPTAIREQNPPDR